jgi:hypothetical protein
MTAPKFEWEPELCVEVFHRMRNSISVVWDVMLYICRFFIITFDSPQLCRELCLDGSDKKIE